MEIKAILKECKEKSKYTNIIELLGSKILYSSNINNLLDLEKYNINLMKNISNYNDNFTYYIYYYLNNIIYEQILKIVEGRRFRILQVHSKTKYKYYKNNDLNIYLSDNYKQEYAVIKYRNVLYVFSKNRDESRSLLYVIREIIRVISQRNGNIILHAGCVKNQKQNILIVGDSRSGKTTLIFQLLKNIDFEFISNDRTLVDNNLKTSSFPIKIRVGVETIKHIETLKKYITFNKINEKENSKIILYPIDIKKWKRIKETKNSTDAITKIIVPNIKPNIDNNRMEKLSEKLTKEILERNCYILKDPEWKNKWFEDEYLLDEKEIKDNKDKIINKLITRVKTYRLNYNGVLDKKSINKILEE